MFTTQSLTDEIKRLRRVNEQQAHGWKVCSEKLRDAEVYIKVLEDENELFQQTIAQLEGGDS